MSSDPKKFPNSPTPDFEPIPGSPPKRFPDKPEPLSTQHPRSSAAEGEDDDTPARSGSGEDPLVESGLPDNDPERPKETDEGKSME